MKLYTAILAAGLLLPGAAFAQSNTSTTQTSNQTGIQDQQQNQNPSTQIPDQSTSSRSQMSSQSGMGQDQTLEGCVTRQETAFYLTPANGAAVRLMGGQDLSSAENHTARITGHYDNGQNSSASSSTSTTNPSSSNPPTSASTLPGQSGAVGSETSPTGTVENQTQPSTTQSGAVAAETGTQPTQPDSSIASQSGQNAQFVVTRVDSVASSCPATSTPNGSTGTSTTPPPLF